MSHFECFSVTVSTIYCSNPKLTLFFVRNWSSPYINEKVNCCAQLSCSSVPNCCTVLFKSLNIAGTFKVITKWWHRSRCRSQFPRTASHIWGTTDPCSLVPVLMISSVGLNHLASYLTSRSVNTSASPVKDHLYSTPVVPIKCFWNPAIQRKTLMCGCDWTVCEI